MTPKCKQTIQEMIDYLGCNCTVDTFKKSNRINWEAISYYKYLSEDFMREFSGNIYWISISSCQTLSEDFIRDFQNQVYWTSISARQTLSEDFIREFQDKVHWMWISKCQTLSENFIKEFQDKVHWWHISLFQVVSEEFLEEHQDRFEWQYFLFGKAGMSLSDCFLLRFSKQIEKFGTPTQIERLKELENQIVDRTYDIIL